MAAALNAEMANRRGLPSAHEVEEFTQKVDEVSILIDGLSKGSISPAYVDSKLAKDSTPQVHA